MQAHDIPLQGISADLKEPGADTIMIRVGSAAGGYLTHWIRHPAQVILEQTVVPVNFAFDSKYIYGFTTLGQRVESMRLNPLVCFEVDELVESQPVDECYSLRRYRGITR